MKKLLSLIMLLLCAVVGVKGESITITWLPNNAASVSAAGTASVADIVSVSNLTPSTPVTFGSSLLTYDSKKWGSFTSSNRPSKNYIAATDYVAFTVTVGEGVTFTPTGATAYAVGIGTGNNGVGLYSSIQGSNTKSTATNSSSASSVTQMSISLSGSYTSGQSVTFYIHIGQNNTTANKGIAIRDVVLTGTYTKEDVVTYSLTTSSAPAVGGVITRSPNQAAFSEGKSVTLTATPNYAYEFVNWTKGGAEVSTNASYAITTVAAEEEYVANFSKQTTYALTTTANPSSAGTITRDADHEEYIVGDNVTLIATPKTGYAFVNWTKGGVEVSTDASFGITTADEAEEYVANFKQLYSVSYNVGDGEKGTTGKVLTTEYYDLGETFTVPNNWYIVKDGYTCTAWSDGVNNYTPGSAITISGNVTLTPVFTANTTALGEDAVNVNWTFAPENGAPVLNVENATCYYVKQVTIGGEKLDVPMFINAVANAGISGKTGKLNNVSQTNRAQVNAGTIFTIPAMNGMVVTVTATNTGGASKSSMKFGGNDADSYSAGVLTYTYSGSENTLSIIDQGNSLYPSGISVSYPVRDTKCQSPTIAVGDFTFEHKGYTVTITAKEGETLSVSTDGISYTEQTSPYETYATETTTYYAKASADGKEDSYVVDEEAVVSYDSSKKFIAWVYTKGYGTASYAFATDPMVTELKKSYNVVEVNYSEGTTPSTDLNNADLIVCTEAMAGNKTMSNGMKAFAGVTPMIGLKAYNYTKDRWSWGTPANPSPTAQAFTPKSSTYKLFDGVTFESDGTVKLATAESGNVIQTVSFGTTDTTAPEGNTILGTIGSDDTKAVMYAANKFFGLGLSSDCWSTYTDNAIAIVKNAAAMLMAGEDLSAEVSTVKKTISTAGYATLCSSYPLDFTGSGLTAYIATASGDEVSFTEVTSVPANTGVLLKGTAGEKTINVSENSTDVSANVMKGVLVDTPIDAEAGFVLMGSGSAGVAFYKNTNAFTVGANTAYIPAAVAPARQFIGFDFDEATAIKAVESVKAENAAFNLRGQRVKNLTKGLYIVNGKKVVK